MKNLLLLLALVIAAGFTTCKEPNKTNGEITCTIRFDANKGTGGPDNVTATFDKPLPKINAADKPAREGYYLTGYWDEASGGKQYYDNNLSAVAGLRWDKTEDTTLYAQWSLIPVTTINFNNNNGTGSMDNQQIPEKTSVNLTANTFTRIGYTFAGWAATADGMATYTDGQSYTAGAETISITLYAVWSAKTYTINFVNTGGTGGQTATVTATYDAAMPAITAVPTSSNSSETFTGYWDATTGGKKYYNTDKSSAANWDKDANTTLYAQFASLTMTLATQSVVSLVQSTDVSDVKNITYDQILALTREAIKLAGGLNGIVKSGDNVVLKPNLVTTYENWNTSGTPLPKTANGVCTDWRVTQAVAQIVREIVGNYDSANNKGKIMVMEGSAGGTMTNNFKNTDYTMANLTYVNELIGLDAEGTTFSAGGSNTTGDSDILTYNQQVTVANPSYTHADHTQYSAWGTTYPYYDEYYKNDGKYWVNKKMYNADVLISIPALKNHWDACVSGSIKNISIGAAPPKIYGASATNMGRNGMVNHASINLHRWIADYFTAIPADFVVMDGLQGLQDGPGSGNYNALVASWKNMRCMLASRDPLAIDIVESNIINWDYAILPYFQYLTERGEVGGKPNGRKITLRGNPKDIVVVGNVKVDDVRSDFKGTMQATMVGKQLTEAQKTKPTVTINSAAFSESNLNLTMALSSGADNAVVKIDVYIDNTYKGSFNTGMAGVSLDASSLASGSHNIEVRAFTKYMSGETATTTAVK